MPKLLYFLITFMKIFSLFLACLTVISLNAQPGLKAVEQYGIFEISLPGPSGGNPFTDVKLAAQFISGAHVIDVKGFYDGNGAYKIRFMPMQTGTWKYTTSSNSKPLNKQVGSFECIAPSAGNHGPVKVSDTYYFKYADGKSYLPFGTTVYALIHQGKELQQQTLQTLQQSPFNKLRFCVFPKTYSYVDDEPALYPYESVQTIKNQDGSVSHRWDFTRFNPAFFQQLEKRVAELGASGIEADLILFHPYDKGKWGFDSMGRQHDILFLEYITARLSSYRNIWWSMANEFDYITTKPREVWDEYSKTVVENDPYDHLCSIHNGSVYYDHWKPYFTHVSIQNGAAVEDFGRANLLRDVYFKPVIYDEVCYEGNLTQRWGRLSGEEMTEAFWQASIAGTYATHGETYRNKGDTIFWAEGGKLVGTSVARIGFLRQLLENAPGPLQLADEWKDVHTAQVDSSYYLIYFGKKMQSEWVASLPRKNGPKSGTRFSVEIIDTWDMTISAKVDTIELAPAVDYRMMDKHGKKIRLPVKPYLALRLIKI